ncbi:MAG: hypothetical protein WB558_18840 [Terriglobales bacterium]
MGFTVSCPYDTRSLKAAPSIVRRIENGMVTGSLLFGILLVLLYVAYYFERYLQSIAASLIEINAQMDAFIKGASSLVELAPENIEKMYLLHGKLYWWAALGRRVYSNHGDWFHEHEDKST